MKKALVEIHLGLRTTFKMTLSTARRRAFFRMVSPVLPLRTNSHSGDGFDRQVYQTESILFQIKFDFDLLL